MRKLFVLYFFLCLSAQLFGQTGKLSGSVSDAETKTFLELATVTILGQDSSLVAYRLSDKTGRFSFDKLPLKRKLLVSISYTGYSTHHTSIQFDTDKPDTLDVLLELNSTESAVIVTATVPIRMNGDTLEINPSAFRMAGDAVVEELLNQVSGITIWSDGTITINGKKVQNFFVDGKPFLGSNDSRVATQNLPKSAIDKIQVYQEYDRSRIGQEQSPQDSLLTMNIKLKESSKKGYFGKAGIGAGTRERFESDMSFQVYNKRTSAGVGGGFNNINKNIGNLQEMFQNNTYRNYNPNLYNVGRFGTSGISKNHSLGGVYTHSFIEESNTRQNNRLSVNYNKSGTDIYISDVNLSTRTTLNNPLLEREQGVQNNNSNKHDFGFNYVRTNSYYDNLTLNGTMSSSTDKNTSSRFSEVRDTANRLQSTNNTTTVQKRQSDNESLAAVFARQNSEDPLRSFSVQLNGRRGDMLSERNVTSAFESLTDAGKSFTNNRRYTTHTNSLSIGGSLDYYGFKRMLLGRYSFFGIDLRFAQSINYNRFMDNTRVGDYDSTSKQYTANGNLSNQNKRELMEYVPSLALSKNFYKYRNPLYRSIYAQVRLLQDIRTEKNSSSFAKRNLDRSFRFFRYEGSISYNNQKNGKYYFYLVGGYNKNFEYASVDQLYTIVDNINAYDTRIGNPNLKNRVNHRFSVNSNYETQNPKAVYTTNSSISGSYTRVVNPVADSIVNETSGKRISYFINVPESQNMNLSYSFNISRKLKKSGIQLMYTGQFNRGKMPNYIDSHYNISNTNSLVNQISLQFSFRSFLIMNLAQTLQTNKTEQTAEGLTSFNNTNNISKFGLVLNYPANFTFSSTMDHINNSNLNKPTILWNAFASYRFMKQQGELKFSAMDLLKQYQNISNSVNAFGTTTRITNGLQQYFLLTFSYYPRKFGKTEIRKKTDQPGM